MKKVNFYNERFLMFVIDMLAYEMEKEGRQIIRMTLGKSELPMHSDIVDAFKKAISDYKKYSLVFPAGLPELKEALADFYNKDFDTSISPKNIIISVGTSSIFRNLFAIILNPGDEVLIPRPYYSLYKFCGLLSGAQVKYYDINNSDLTVDMASFRNNFNERTKIVVINSPGNPLGNTLSEAEFREIDDIVDGKAYIISDEIYINMAFDEKPVSALGVFGWGDKCTAKSKIIITNAFSKGYRMYSRRVGWGLVPDELVEPLTVIQHHTLLTTDPVAQYAAMTALDHPEELDELRDLYRERRNYTISGLNGIEGIKVIPSKGSFYISLDCGEFMKNNGIKSELELAEKIIKTVGVATVPGSDFGAPGTLRLSFTSTDYKRGIDLLRNFFSS